MDIEIPDIGDFTDVPVLSILVKVGDDVTEEDPLLELESDKASMEVPSPVAGTITSIRVAEGDIVSMGTVIMGIDRASELIESISKVPAAELSATQEPVEYDDTSSLNKPTQTPAATLPTDQRAETHVELLVLGSGPGGYTAAFRAADLGLNVVLVERDTTLGGVCLNVGCIPSKALLHAAKVLTETEEMQQNGISSTNHVDIDALRSWKDGIVSKLTGGLKGLAKARKVTIVKGFGRFTGPHTVEVVDSTGTQSISFDQGIIAAGSEPVTLPFIPHDDERVIDSTGALELADVPKRLLVLGGGIIGLEMATVYDALGSKVTIVELMDQIIPGADKDIVKPLHTRIKSRYENILLGTKVTSIRASEQGLQVSFEGASGTAIDTFDKVLVAVGRVANGGLIGLENTGVGIDERGFIVVDKQQRTNVAHIYAIGDVVGQPMLAHKAVHEGKVAAEVCAGHLRAFDAEVIPSVAYTDPEVAWVGITETEAKARGLKVGTGSFPWAASGRSLCLGRSEGLTKLIFDPIDDRVVGAGIVGPNAGDLIAEIALAIEMGADATDVSHTIHPHPTLSETVNFAAEMYEGTITDLIAPKKKLRK